MSEWIDKDLGPVDAYALAVAGGYEGTKQQWIAEIAGASTNASNTEAYAKGTRGGEAVASDDPAYHNNAKYYNEQAALEKASAQAAAATASAAYNVNLLAANYDATKTYAVGDHVIYSGGYYRCNTAITTAEAWTAAHWTQLTLGGEITGLKSASVSYKGTIQNAGISNLNDAVYPAIYHIGDYTGISNLPTDLNGIPIVGTLIVQSNNRTDNYKRLVQFLWGRDNLLYFRGCFDNTWTSWEIISNSLSVREAHVAQITNKSVISSLDNCEQNLIYRINVTSASLLPDNSPASQGIVYTIGYNLDGTQTRAQFFIAVNGNYYYRLKWGTTWTSWVNLNFTSIINQINCPFESYGRSSNVIKEVIVTGISSYDQRFIISNIRNHYNGQNYNAFYIYLSDDTGTAGTPLKEFKTTETAGDCIIELPAYGAIFYVEYDFSTISSGGLYGDTGLSVLIKRDCYNKLMKRTNSVDFGFIEKFAVVGDSYASGEIYVADTSSQTGYTAQDYYNLSWGQILARKYGSTCINMSKGGLTTRTWLTDAMGLTLMQNSDPQPLYLCALGHNDEGNPQYGIDYLGDITDITGHSSYEDYGDTFYGNYGRIIEQIQEHAPSAKIVLMTVAYLYNAVEDSFNSAIIEIANHYNIPYIDIKESDFYSSTSLYHTGKMWNHPTAPIYAGMAYENADLFCKCVEVNYNYFKDFTGSQAN